jgi:hypothetical protein
MITDFNHFKYYYFLFFLYYVLISCLVIHVLFTDLELHRSSLI